MDFLQPTTWDEALAAKAAHPDAVPICGGTDVMVELNFDRRRPAALLDLGRVAELREWAPEDGHVRLGAGVTYSRVIAELGRPAAGPGDGLAHGRLAADPQPRHGRRQPGRRLAGRRRAPAAAGGRHAGSRSRRCAGTRVIPVEDFYTGVKRNALAPDELIRAVLVTPPTGPQQFSKIGTRNAMVIAVAAFGLALHPDRKAVGTGIGSAAPTPRRARGRRGAPRRRAGRARACGSPAARCHRAWPRSSASWSRPAASPIDDVRGSAAYRRHALAGDGPPGAPPGPGTTTGRRPDMRVTTTVNGERREADDVWEGESLLYVLRERLGLPGSKNACEQGECGSCTVYLDGVPVCACLVAAGQAEGREIGTVEGLADGDRAAPRPAGVRRGGRGAVRLLHPRPARAAHDLLAREPRPDRPRDPRGAGRQPVPLHRLREDPGRRAPGAPGALAGTGPP